MRVLVGAFFLESNSFSIGRTGLDQFAVAGLRVGSDLRRESLPDQGELAAAWDLFASRGVEVVPALYAWSPPGPPIPAADFDQILQMIRDNATPRVDGAYLQLHGSALAEGVDDPEGVVLAELRRIIGPRTPLAISLDCHANLTDAMAGAVDIVTAYRTVPHVDLARSGRQAAELLVAAMSGAISPRLSVVRIPLITPADLHDNGYPPFGSLMTAAERAEEGPPVLAAAVLPVTPWLDVPDIGWRVAVTSDGEAEVASDVASRIAQQAWNDRRAFFAGNRPTIEEALAHALRAGGPFVIADAGDATNGGSPGDSTCLLRAATRFPDRRIFMTVADPEAAERLSEVPVGATVEMSLGHGNIGEYNAATRIEAVVVAHPAGTFEYTHPFSNGQRGDLGEPTVLAVGEQRVVVHRRPVGLIDPSPYVAAGLDPSSAEVLQAKSHISYRTGFAGIATDSVVADTPGPTAANLALLPYTRRPVPLYPFEEPDLMLVKARVFTRTPDGTAEAREVV